MDDRLLKVIQENKEIFDGKLYEDSTRIIFLFFSLKKSSKRDVSPFRRVSEAIKKQNYI